MPSPADRSVSAPDRGTSTSPSAAASDAASSSGGTATATPGGAASGVGGGSGTAPAATAGGGGRGTGTGGAGGDGAGGGVARATPGSGEGIDFAAYDRMLRRHILESFEYPASVRRRGLRGTVEVDILVRADGAIQDVKLARSSSESALDAAAVEAVRRLPPVRFPPGLPPRTLRVRVPVVFDPR